MGDVVIQETRQQFSVNGQAALTTLLKLSTAAMGLSSGLQAAQMALAVISGPVNTITNNLARVAGIQSKLEERRLSMAGQLSAYDAVGRSTQQISAAVRRGADAGALMTQNFELANTRAGQLMETIQQQAAALPGSAEDYLTVFDSALPSALANTRRSLGEILNTSNLFAAVGVVNQQQIDMVGRDFALMMQGMAGQQVNMFRILRPLMHGPNNRQINSGQQFNALTGEQRYQAITGALSRYSVMMDRFSNTWSTQLGTFQSTILSWQQRTTGPIFQVMKNVLGDINKYLDRITPLVVTIGKQFAFWASQGLKDAFSMIQRIGSQLSSGAFRFLMSDRMTRAAAYMTNLVGSIFSGPSSGGGITAATTAAGGGMGLMGGGLAFGSFIAMIQNHFDVFLGLVDKAGVIFDHLVNTVWNVMSILGLFTNVGADVQAGLLPVLFSITEAIAAWYEAVSGQALMALKELYYETYPSMRAEIIRVYTQLQQFYNGLSLLYAMNIPLRFVVEGFRMLAGVLRFVVGHLLEMIPSGGFGDTAGAVNMARRWLQNGFNTDAEQINDPLFAATTNIATALNKSGRAINAEAPEWLNTIRNVFGNIDVIRKQMTAKTNIDGERASRRNQQSPHTNNDFRYSRFDITQKFAEGFDPDRIAAVFARDLEGLAEQRMSSGFNPAFSVM